MADTRIDRSQELFSKTLDYEYMFIVNSPTPEAHLILLDTAALPISPPTQVHASNVAKHTIVIDWELQRLQK
jgi:hypothetical protein